MKTFIGGALALAILLGGTGCSLFEDPGPENIGILLSGEDGVQVRSIYSKVFVAGLSDQNTTTVQVLQADTVLQTLPVDTVVSIRQERQFFIQVELVQPDTIEGVVQVDVDGRNVMTRQIIIQPDFPWRYLYLFNNPLTSNVEIII